MSNTAPNIPNIKVVHIASGDLWAGAEAQLFTLAKTLKNKTATDVHVILMNHGTLEQKLIAEDIHVTVFDETKLSALQILVCLIKKLREIKPNIVHTHRLKENILGSIACLFAGKIASIRTAHGAPEHQPSWRHFGKRIINSLDWLCGLLLQKKIVAVSEDLATILKKKYPSFYLSKEAKEGKVCVIENGVDLEEVGKYIKIPTDNSPNNPTHFKVGIVGRLVPVKRMDIFIGVAKHLNTTNSGFTVSYHIYGEGPLKEELYKLALNQDVSSIVHFEGHRMDILSQIAELDVLMISSDHEGLPMTLLETMVLGVPVVAHCVGGIKDACYNTKCAWLADSNTVAAMSAALYLCLTDPIARAEKTKLAQLLVKQRFSSEINACAIRQIYQELSNQSCAT